MDQDRFRIGVELTHGIRMAENNAREDGFDRVTDMRYRVPYRLRGWGVCGYRNRGHVPSPRPFRVLQSDFEPPRWPTDSPGVQRTPVTFQMNVSCP